MLSIHVDNFRSRYGPETCHVIHLVDVGIRIYVDCLSETSLTSGALSDNPSLRSVTPLHYYSKDFRIKDDK